LAVSWKCGDNIKYEIFKKYAVNYKIKTQITMCVPEVTKKFDYSTQKKWTVE
jgi:hypothetical protein